MLTIYVPTIFPLDFGIVPMIWYIFFKFYCNMIYTIKFEQWLIFCLHCTMITVTLTLVKEYFSS